MIKIMKELWNKREKNLRNVLAGRLDARDFCYADFVKLTFEIIFNDDPSTERKLDLKNMTEIDNGDYQGTLLYLIPFKTYQPTEREYLMTYIGYGSCSGCDSLQAAINWRNRGALTETELAAVMEICKDIVCDTIKPYNSGWRCDEKYQPVEEKV